MNEKRGTSFKSINSKKGQVTIFIILGIIIVGAAALIYFLYPQIKSTFTRANDPQSFIQTCLQDEIKSTITNLSLQGGSIAPQNYFQYYNDWNNDPSLQKLYGVGLHNVEYLCYTNKYYVPCVMQQPLLQQHIESEIKDNIQQTADSCFSDMQKNYQNQGYTVNFVKGDSVVDILPQRVVVTFNNQLTLTKQNAQRYENFSVLVNNNLYELVGIATSILNWESSQGDAPVQSYMIYYHNLIVEKKEVGASSDPNAGGRNTDGTKVYILTDLNTGNIFQFATRSMAWPAGMKLS